MKQYLDCTISLQISPKIAYLCTLFKKIPGNMLLDIPSKASCLLHLHFGLWPSLSNFPPLLNGGPIGPFFSDFPNALLHDVNNLAPVWFFFQAWTFHCPYGNRQGDNVSPKVFTSCLQYAIINKINWENKGVRNNGEHLSHVIFANDIVFIANSTLKLQEMLQGIHDISKLVGLDASGED